MNPRISAAQLAEISDRLTDCDREIIGTLQRLRCLRTNQLQRLFFTASPTPRAGLSATTKALSRLQKLGLINHLPREIGGCRAGSKGLIWYLTEPGFRLLKLGTDDTSRSRFLEPSASSRRHTIAVAECYVQFTEICRMAQDMTLSKIELEPECWREYQRNGKNQSLRPDLYAETVVGKFEDRWFVEMDLATESMQDVMVKCERYYYYYATQREQRVHGVFPVVLWIVPNDARKQSVIQSLQSTFHKRFPPIHLVITPNQLWTVLTEGAKAEDLC